MKRLAFLFIPLLLSACGGGSGVRDTLGLTRTAPDEFRVVSRPPLSVPPDFSLRPPAAPGEVTPGGTVTSPRDQAQTLLLGGDGSTVAPGTAPTAVQPVGSAELPSAADDQFLKNAGADRAEPGVRQQLSAEQAQKQDAAEDKTWLQKLREPSSNEPTVNAKAEADRIKTNQSDNKPVTEGDTPTVKSRDTGTLGRIFGY